MAGVDLPPHVEHLCDSPAEVQPGAQRHQQALPSRGGKGHTWYLTKLNADTLSCQIRLCFLNFKIYLILSKDIYTKCGSQYSWHSMVLQVASVTSLAGRTLHNALAGMVMLLIARCPHLIFYSHHFVLPVACSLGISFSVLVSHKN